MGQYFRPILLAEDKKTPLFNIHTWDFQCGMKLTEHAYIGNPVLGAIEKIICDKPTDDFVEIIPNFVDEYAIRYEKVVYPNVELVNVM